MEVNMRLKRVGQDVWEVLTVLDSRGRSPVLDFLHGLDESYRTIRNNVLYMLKVQIPKNGPPRRNRDLCKPLGKGLFELRRQPKGPKLRVVFFYDSGNRIVCVRAFLKAETTPKPDLEIATSLRRLYFEALFEGRLTIEEEDNV
jgi:phage-related protein